MKNYKVTDQNRPYTLGLFVPHKNPQDLQTAIAATQTTIFSFFSTRKTSKSAFHIILMGRSSSECQKGIGFATTMLLATRLT